MKNSDEALIKNSIPDMPIVDLFEIRQDAIENMTLANLELDAAISSADDTSDISLRHSSQAYISCWQNYREEFLEEKRHYRAPKWIASFFAVISVILFIVEKNDYLFVLFAALAMPFAALVISRPLFSEDFAITGKTPRFRKKMGLVGSKLVRVGNKAIYAAFDGKVRTIYFDAIGSVYRGENNSLVVNSRLGQATYVLEYAECEGEESLDMVISIIKERLEKYHSKS